MRYVDRVLLPNERVLYRARISAALYFPGMVLLMLAVLAALYLQNIDRLGKLFANATYYVPLLDYTANILSIILFFVGVLALLRAYMIQISTELAVTSRRVIAKYGVTTTTTTEIDRHKIAGVIIRQSPWGKILDYGRVMLRGYSGDISHLPPIAKPYDFQKFVNERIRLE